MSDEHDALEVEDAREEITDDEAADTAGADEPVGPTPREERALERARKVSRLMDDAIPVPGTDRRIGLDPILGVLPGGGDAIAAGISLYPVLEAYRLGAPRELLAKMLALVAIDTVGGSVPVLGVLFDALFTANEWNVEALERHVEDVRTP